MDPQERQESLASIIKSFASLHLSSQSAHFEIMLYTPKTPFQPENMEDVSPANEVRADPAPGAAVHTPEGNLIQCVVFPGVVKRGEVVSVIAKARVLT